MHTGDQKPKKRNGHKYKEDDENGAKARQLTKSLRSALETLSPPDHRLQHLHIYPSLVGDLAWLSSIVEHLNATAQYTPEMLEYQVRFDISKRFQALD